MARMRPSRPPGLDVVILAGRNLGRPGRQCNAASPYGDRRFLSFDRRVVVLDQQQGPPQPHDAAAGLAVLAHALPFLGQVGRLTWWRRGGPDDQRVDPLL